MMYLINKNDLEGVGGNKVFDRGATSGRDGSHEIITFFEDFCFLRFRRHFMIIVDTKNNCLERVDAVDRILRIILCINRYKLAMNHMSIVPDQILLFTNQFLDLGTALWRKNLE
jgi:hypothetical protein